MTPVRARNLQETRITSLDEVRPLGRPRFRHWDLLSNFAGRQFRAGWRHADRHDRRALGVADAVNSCGARARGAAVDMQGAGAAQRYAAAEFRAGHAEPVAQHPEQRRIAVDIDATGAR
jgi:hypothetical protein